MQLGWIDFSKEEKNKVLDVINLLEEPGTLDELGIAQIRNGFADLFFPGTSTLQTRAKYFFLVPYSCISIERSNETDEKRFIRKLDEIEHECGKHLLEMNEDGTIGKVSITNGGWVKRPPSTIYWAGIRSYGIFKGERISLRDYVHVNCKRKLYKKVSRSQGLNESEFESGKDDNDAGGFLHTSFWHVPDFKLDNWNKEMTMKLSLEESKFLKTQIIKNHPDSLMAFILKKNSVGFLKCNRFEDVKNFVDNEFSQQTKKDYNMAVAFARFLFGIRIQYNLIVSNDKNEKAVECWIEFEKRMNNDGAVDLEEIYERLNISNYRLKQFLLQAKQQMLNEDIVGLKNGIVAREKFLKGSGRAKTSNVGDFPIDKWFSGGVLSYRMENAKMIIQDIFEGEGLEC